MNINSLNSIGLIFFLLSLFHCQKYISKPTPKLTNGILDLRGWELRKEKVFEITGDYLFYPNFLLIKNDSDPSLEPIEGCFFDSGNSKGDFECNGYEIPQTSHDLLENKVQGYSVDIPHRWKDKQYGSQILTAKGVGLYRLQFQIQEPTKLSFTSEPDFSLISYRLWLKSGNKITLIQKSGHPTPTPQGMRSHSIPVFVTEVISDGDELLLEIANWENRVGGLKSGLFIGNPREVSNFRDIAIWSSLVIFGFNTMAGLYHFFLFILRPSNRYTLWFGIFCVVIGMRVLVISKPIQIYFPDMDAFSFLLKLEYLTMTGSMAIFIVYIKEVLENKIFYPWYYVVMFISICSSLVIVSTDTFTFTNLLTYFQLGLLVGLLWIAFELIKHSFFKIPNNARNKYISRSITYVSIIFIASIVHDIFMYQGFLRSVELTAYGLVLFLLGQGVVIARVNAKAWSNSEHLSKNLQKEVELRTIDYKEQKEIAEKAFINLKESQDKLILAEKQATLNQIITNISHELNTPLGAIQATSESLKISILNLQTLLKNYIHNMGSDQNSIDLESIFKILNHISTNSNSYTLSTRDQRKLQKELKEELKFFISKNQLNENNRIDNLSLQILEAGLYNIYKEYSNLLKSQNAGLLEFFVEYNGLLMKANLFKSSSEKMFKTVTMIRSLLPDREEIVKDNLDLVSIIKESLEIYSNKIQAGIQLHLDFQEYPIVAGTYLEYKQVFANIILNAIQAVENSVDKNIYIKTFMKESDKIVVEVEDSGIGISEENQSKIFQPMFTTRQHAEGSGLGLYISQRNLNKYGYKLSFESKPGKTRFWIEI
jgi:signal transduction histidine kinase